MKEDSKHVEGNEDEMVGTSTAFSKEQVWQDANGNTSF